jgi:hypothetical protein
VWESIAKADEGFVCQTWESFDYSSLGETEDTVQKVMELLIPKIIGPNKPGGIILSSPIIFIAFERGGG